MLCSLPKQLFATAWEKGSVKALDPTGFKHPFFFSRKVGEVRVSFTIIYRLGLATSSKFGSLPSFFNGGIHRLPGEKKLQPFSEPVEYPNPWPPCMVAELGECDWPKPAVFFRAFWRGIPELPLQPPFSGKNSQLKRAAFGLKPGSSSFQRVKNFNRRFETTSWLVIKCAKPHI